MNMDKVYVPELSKFKTQLSVLIGKGVNLSEVKTPNRFTSSAQAAIYILDDDHLAAMIRFDLSLSASLGAALAMMPASAASEAVESGALDGDLLDAFSEVANIMAGLLCYEGAPHVRLATINECDPRLKDEFLSALSTPCTRLDLALEIDEFDRGNLTLWTAKLA